MDKVILAQKLESLRRWEIVFAICKKFLVDFRRFAKEITDYSTH